MVKKRVSGAERRKLILHAARRVFSRDGYEGGKTLQIAREAKVSEALLYHHFPSKHALYRAVLREIFREQDENWQALGLKAPGAEGIVHALKFYFNFIVTEPDAEMQVGFRMILESLTGDGYFASLIYRRSQRWNRRTIAAAHAQAREAGDMVGEAIDINDASMFIEHVGTMLSAIHRLPPASRPYSRSADVLVRDAVWFCCRGIGLTDEAVSRHLGD